MSLSKSDKDLKLKKSSKKRLDSNKLNRASKTTQSKRRQTSDRSNTNTVNATKKRKRKPVDSSKKPVKKTVRPTRKPQKSRSSESGISTNASNNRHHRKKPTSTKPGQKRAVRDRQIRESTKLRRQYAPQIIGESRRKREKDSESDDLEKKATNWLSLIAWGIGLLILMGGSIYFFNQFMGVDSSEEESNTPSQESQGNVVIEEAPDEDPENKETSRPDQDTSDSPSDPMEVPEIQGTLDEPIDIDDWRVTLDKVVKLPEDFEAPIEDSGYVLTFTFENRSESDALRVVNFVDQTQLRTFISDSMAVQTPIIDYEGELDNGYKFEDMTFERGSSETVSLIFDVDEEMVSTLDDYYFVFIADTTDIYGGRLYYSISDLITSGTEQDEATD